MSDLTPAEKASVIRQVEAIPKRRQYRKSSKLDERERAGMDEIVRMYRAYKADAAEVSGNHDAALLRALLAIEQDVMRRARADLERKLRDWER